MTVTMFFVALKILLYDKVRSCITLLGVVFAVSLIFAQVGIFLGLMETSSVIIDKTSAEIWVTSKNSKNFDFSQPIPESIYNQVLATEGVKECRQADNLLGHHQAEGGWN